MSDQTEIAQIRERERAATTGPWEAYDASGIPPGVWGVSTVDGRVIVEADFIGHSDAEFIAHARTDIPYLLDALVAAETRAAQAEQKEDGSLLNPVSQVYFRAGLLACREYMARFVESENLSIAMSIRANWWPLLGDDPGPPRQLAFGELTDGEYGTAAFRCKTVAEVSPSLEALPIALGFLQQPPALAAPPPREEPTCEECGCEERDHRGLLTCRCPARLPRKEPSR